MCFCYTDNSNITIQSVIIDLIKQKDSRYDEKTYNNNKTSGSNTSTINYAPSLIIVLGDKSRQFIETELKKLLTKRAESSSDDDHLLTINDIRRLDKDIKILFLNKLQYLFMYLTYLEVDSDLNSNKFQYNNIIIFGLDEQMSKVQNASGKIEMIKLYQLILNSFYSLKHKFDTINKLLIVSYNNNTKEENGSDVDDNDYISFKNIELQINNYCKYINGQ
ncbi:Shu1p PWA37_002425 [Arxiozyma heterogenica]|uniref:Shu1p n=1 Tax=Arxiozyma heterogenica TaxID=278026 RepID=UPI002EF64B83